MKRCHAHWIVPATLSLLLAFAAVPCPVHAGGQPGVGDPAPPFTVPDIAGNTISLEEILKSGKVVLLNFWGIRCGNCLTEIGYLNPMHEQFAPKGAVFLGINVDGAQAEMLTRQIPRMPSPPKFTVIPDPEMKIPDLYKLSGAPLSIIVGKNGKIAYRHEDFKDGDEKEIEKSLKEALAAK